MIMRAREKMIAWDILKPMLEDLTYAANNDEQKKIKKLLNQIVPEFIPNTPHKD